MRKRHVATASAGVALGLIITPMLDMSFQILSFFIMTYHPSALEGHVNGTLPPPKSQFDPKKEPVLVAAGFGAGDRKPACMSSSRRCRRVA